MAHKLTSIIAHYPNARNANDLLIDRIVASDDNRNCFGLKLVLLVFHEARRSMNCNCYYYIIQSHKKLPQRLSCLEEGYSS